MAETIIVRIEKLANAFYRPMLLIRPLFDLLLTYLTGERCTRASGALLPRPHQNTTSLLMPLQQRQLDALKEA